MAGWAPRAARLKMFGAGGAVGLAQLVDQEKGKGNV
jgi:hypothetical protein